MNARPEKLPESARVVLERARSLGSCSITTSLGFKQTPQQVS